MAEKFPYTCTKETRLLFSSITQKSAPRTVANATPRFSGSFGVCQEDWDNIVKLMVQAISTECGGFSGNPNDYYLACMTSRMAIDRVRAKAELDTMGKNSDDAFKIREKAEKRCVLYEPYAGILQASSQFDIELARLDAGKIVDIKEDHERAQAGKDLFYSGSYVVPRVAFQGFRRKSLDAKDGTTAFLQNVLFIRKGEKLNTGGGAPNQDVFGGFAGYSDFDPLANAPGGDSGFNYQPQGGTDPQKPGSPPPPPSGRPTDPAMIYSNGDGTEQWYVNGDWDGEGHPEPKPGSPPPPPARQAGAGADKPMW